ncbi:hydantoinase/oxoprolinase family protein [Capillimicrobium parvum]|uniref:Acetophenone carboxylase gamma subunit n=1 Tax=Capillimicrobium parvum TaxID=2884022 RepID=A0A9E7C018_9ACTN|nr:hydantoinase/oxoprolinase family protein [Capillimicrobium parvum]UGS35955.1 Acetophenone carboxylase gamma subunit [Capillimicrobium parvum]
MDFRISVDTGGTFTDVVVVDAHGEMHIGKALTTAGRAFDAIREALEQIAPDIGLTVAQLLAQASQFAYGTTRATNAIVEGKTARTAFFTTRGFPDILLMREGGKLGPFRHQPFPPPYVPRYLTFEITERVDSDGEIFLPLDEASIVEAIDGCRSHGVEAVGVCLLWSTVNPAHEIRVGELLDEHLDVSVTLSHLLNPVIREYRRASSTVIDASLKPLMQRFLGDLDDDLRAAGFAGNLLVSTSFGGSWPTAEMIDRPIYSVGSGPSMAPVAGLECGRAELPTDTPDLLVCDTGGTTFDVGLISSGQIHYTADTWLGERWTGHITGTKAVDVRSIGAGGGSIVSVDSGGLMHVGPDSAGAEPGPACYGMGGADPTITDAAVLLGYLDPDGFLGGRLHLDVAAARRAFEGVAARLGKTVEEAAQGAMVIATQNVVSAIREITIAQGIDPRELAIVAGGGASGLNVVQMARELGCRQVLLPRTAGALSASGALQADLISEFSVSRFAETRALDRDAVNAALASAKDRADGFVESLQALAPRDVRLEASVDARYPGQVWELETPLPATRLRDDDDVRALVASFHDIHERVFAVKEPGQYVECLIWRVRATAELDKPRIVPLASAEGDAQPLRHRNVIFARHGAEDTPVYAGELLPVDTQIAGPAVVLEPTTTLVIDPGAVVRVSEHGTYIIDAGPGEATPQPIEAAVQRA